MAELGEDEKNRVSHRARAFAALRPVLEQVLARARRAQVASVSSQRLSARSVAEEVEVRAAAEDEGA